MIPFAIPGVLSALMGNPWARLAAVGILAFGFGFYKGVAFVPRVDIAKVEANAIAGRDAHWRTVLAEKERENDARVTAAVAAAEAEPPVPVDRAERVRQCAASPSCRDRRR